MSRGSKDSWRVFRIAVVLLLLTILYILLNMKMGADEKFFIPEITSPVLKAQSNPDDVGLNDNNTVTQDEPNTTEDPNSPAIDNTPDPTPTPALSTSDFRHTTSNTPANFVAAAQDNNPQNEVGGVNEVNELFKGENIGGLPKPDEGSKTNWFLALGLGSLILMCLFLGLIVFKKKKDEEAES